MTTQSDRQSWRAKLARENENVTRRLLAAYQRTLPILKQELGYLERALEDLETVTPAELRRLEEWRRFQRAVDAEMRAFAAILRNEVGEAQAAGIRQGAQLALALAEVSAGDAAPLVRAAWNRVSPEALERLIGYVDGDEMRRRFASFNEFATESLADTVLAGAAQGRNPRLIADMIATWFAVPYAWAENMTRTAHIWSLRSAAHASYRANPEIVTGWVWSASLDARTCISCWSQHGSRHSVDEVLNDHHRGRCAPLPIVRGTRWADSYEPGEAQFARLSEAEQRAIMGKGLYEAWRAGQVRFDDFSRPYTDGVYGEMLRAATLKELIGK